MRYTDPETGEDQSQHYVMKELRCKKTGIEFNVVTTHLKAKKGFEQMRANQAAQLVEKLKQWNLSATIITGDFNDTPDSLAIQNMLDGTGVQSAAGEQEPEFTTHKYRESTGMQTRTIDYVFY